MSKERGKTFEQIALSYLLKKGFTILETNWRWKYWEIDIVAQKDDWIVFVEVKGRKNADFGKPYEWIDEKKEQALLHAASAYIEQKNITSNVRFDAISIIEREVGKFEIEHFENIFLL